jgi:NIPSNAP
MGMKEGDLAPEPTTSETWSPIVELRQYTLYPGQRDVLIDLFEREFVEHQEELGIRVIGQFRDLDDPDRFVWLRGFPTMAERGNGLQALYGGPVWKQHRDVANATMIDSDNVLLLHPARSDSGFALSAASRPSPGTTGARPGVVIACIYNLGAPVEGSFIDFFERHLAPPFINAGASILGYFATEHSPNNFPALPVREGEYVFVWFAGFPPRRSDEAVIAELSSFGKSMDAPGLIQVPQVLRLMPTARSLLTGSSPACPAAYRTMSSSVRP